MDTHRRVEDSLTDLERESWRLRKGKQSSSTSRTPFYHTLPTELLAEIFKAGAFLPTHRGELPFPLLVSRINRHWRYIALNAPEVWTNVQWHVLSQPFPTIWFERSKSCLLDITLCAVFYQVHIDVRPIIPHFDRCRRFIIKVGDHYDLVELIKPLRNLFAPRLKYAEVHVREEESVDQITTHVLTGGTPNLLSVRLHNACLKYSPPLEGVQTLDIHGWLPNDWQFNLLATTSSLTKLILRECVLLLEDDDEVYTVIEIPSLVSLAISHPKSNHSSNDYQSFLNYLSIPNLEYLEIAHATLSDINHDFPVVADHKLRYPKLQTLRLDSLQLSESHIGECLHRALPTVSHLQLIDTEGARILPARRLLPYTNHHAPSSTEESPRWPNLNTITLEPTSMDNLTWLINIVSIRKDMGKPLSKIRILEAPYTPVSRLFVIARLQKLVSVDIVRGCEMLGMITQQEDKSCGSSECDDASDFQEDVTSASIPACIQPPIIENAQPVIHQPLASTSATSNSFWTDFMPPNPSLDSSLNLQFDPLVFRLDDYDDVDDINFERDFGQWFITDETSANHDTDSWVELSSLVDPSILLQDFAWFDQITSNLPLFNAPELDASTSPLDRDREGDINLDLHSDQPCHLLGVSLPDEFDSSNHGTSDAAANSE